MGVLFPLTLITERDGYFEKTENYVYVRSKEIALIEEFNASYVNDTIKSFSKVYIHNVPLPFKVYESSMVIAEKMAEIRREEKKRRKEKKREKWPMLIF